MNSKYDIGTKASETFIRVFPTEKQLEHFANSGAEAVVWDYGLVKGHIARRRADTPDVTFQVCRPSDVPISVAAMLLSPEPVEVSSMSMHDEIIDKMVAGFIDATLWTENLYDDNNPDDTPMDSLGFVPENIDENSMARIRSDCAFFVNIALHAGVDIEKLYDPELSLFLSADNGDNFYYDWRAIGHDFLLSRNGHGAGFFDRDIPHADLFQHIASRFSEVHAYSNIEVMPCDNLDKEYDYDYSETRWGIE